jgi:hypothetical protein
LFTTVIKWELRHSGHLARPMPQPWVEPRIGQAICVTVPLLEFGALGYETYPIIHLSFPELCSTS